MNTTIKYKLLRETYEKVGYEFTLERDARNDWSWTVLQPFGEKRCQERITGVSATKVRAMKGSIAAIQVLDS